MSTSPRTAALDAKHLATPAGKAAVRGPLAGRFVGGEGDERHVFIVVGVPGSGKDTVIKRYLRTLGLSLLDASADLCKEYLAAWGTDDLSVAVRRNNAEHGPGKHLLHAQYLHRESIFVNNQVVTLALEAGRSLILEKTLHDSEHVLAIAQQLAERGCHVHLFGTHITPLTNWEFLRNRAISGQAFGRYITKEQTIASLRSYHRHFSAILADPTKRAAFDSIHLYDVEANDWTISIEDTTALFPDDSFDETFDETFDDTSLLFPEDPSSRPDAAPR